MIFLVDIDDNDILIEVCTTNWALLSSYLSDLRCSLRRGIKKNHSKYQLKPKSVGEKKLHALNERWECAQEGRKVENVREVCGSVRVWRRNL